LEYYGSTGGEKLLNFTYAYCGGNPFNRIDPDGRWDISDFQALCNNVNAAIKKMNAAYYKLKVKAKQTLKTVNKEAQKYFGMPLISTTATTTTPYKRSIIDTQEYGDKITLDKPLSTTIGKSNRLINLDVATSKEGDKTYKVSAVTGNSLSYNTTTGMLGQGITIGKLELHTSIGSGVGLGEYSGGFEWSTKGVTKGFDVDVRPGFGTLVAAGAAGAYMLYGHQGSDAVNAAAENLLTVSH